LLTAGHGRCEVHDKCRVLDPRELFGIIPRAGVSAAII
jgi:hypothetical protein